MVPRHTGGVGGRHFLRRHISPAQQSKNWCVSLFFPPHADSGIHPTLFLFGFRTDALNSTFLFKATGASEASEGLRPPEPQVSHKPQIRRPPSASARGFKFRTSKPPSKTSFFWAPSLPCLANPPPGKPWPVAPQGDAPKPQKHKY